jgi:hypothetical protein
MTSKEHHGEFFDVWVFGVDSVEGHAVGFDVLTNFGSMFSRLPISALCHKQDAPNMPLDYLELWNNFSYQIESHEYIALRHMRCSTILKDKKWYSAEYMFTLSWFGNNTAESPGDGGFKRGHVLKLDNGCFAIQPNNRIKWFEPSFITKPFPDNPDFKTNSHIWNCEIGDKWATSDNDKYFYEVERYLHEVEGR